MKPARVVRSRGSPARAKRVGMLVVVAWLTIATFVVPWHGVSTRTGYHGRASWPSTSTLDLQVNWTRNVQVFDEIDTSAWSYGVDAFPSVAIALNGDLLVTFKDRLQFGVHDLLIANSSDRLAFSTPRVVASGYNINQYTTSLHVNGTGAIAVVYNIYNGADRVHCTTSVDGGLTFLGGIRVDPHPSGTAARPSIIGNATHVDVCYEYHDGIQRDVFVSTGNAGLASFALPDNVSNTAAVSESSIKLFRDDAGALHAFFYRGDAGLHHAIKQPGHATWGAPTLVVVPDHAGPLSIPSFAGDGKGNVIMVFHGTGGLHYTVSHDACQTWDVVQPIPGTTHHVNPSIAIDGERNQLYILAVDAGVANHWRYKLLVADLAWPDLAGDLVVFQARPGAAPLGSHAYTWLALSDIDYDGNLEILTGSSDQHARVHVYNQGTFSNRLAVDTGSMFPRIVAGFLDGDASPDIAIATSSPGCSFQVLERDGGAWHERATVAPTAFIRGKHALGRGDIDGGGLVELVVPFTNGTWTGLEILAPAGNDQYILRRVLANVSSHESLGVACADVDGDGLVDIITAPNTGDESYRLVIWGSHPNGTVAVTRVGPVIDGARAISIATGDTNGDGIPEIVIGEYCKNRTRGTRIIVLERESDTGGYRVQWNSGNLLPNFVRDDGSWSSVHVAVADATGDGRDEIVAGLGGQDVNRSDIMVLSREANGSYKILAHEVLPGRADFVPVVAGDIDSDGIIDIIAGTTDLHVYELYEIRELGTSPVLFHVGDQPSSGGSVELAWVFNSIADGFTVAMSRDGGAWASLPLPGRSVRSWSHVLASPGVYRFTVAGTNALGTGPPSNVVIVDVAAVHPPGIPGPAPLLVLLLSALGIAVVIGRAKHVG